MWRTRSPSTWHGRQNGPAAPRGFGFTGGHFHKGWAYNDQRKLVLNAILWTAKATVPANDVGIDAATDTFIHTCHRLPRCPQSLRLLARWPDR
ncbi:MAG: hypothetical protein ORN83_15830 [Chthoniobacteraceae bacterium]|nr:hypothetical protein [Chthoniobacteraceae bacterium]